MGGGGWGIQQEISTLDVVRKKYSEQLLYEALIYFTREATRNIIILFIFCVLRSQNLCKLKKKELK